MNIRSLFLVLLEDLLLPRKPDGSLPEITFLRLKPTSAAARAGIGRR